MSYILDALKRADAERERGAIPGLHTPNAASGQMLPERNGWHPAWLIGSVFAGVGVAAAMGWWLAGPTTVVTAPAMPSVTSVSPVPAPPSVPAPPPPPAPAPPPPLPPAIPAPSAVPAPVPAPMAAPAPASAAAPVSRADSASTATSAAPARPAPPLNAPTTAQPMRPSTGQTGKTSPTTTAVPQTQTSTTSVAVSVPLLSEWPEALRREVPALTITGAVYSDNPSQRLLLINNQVLPQGSPVAAGVVLEEIHAKHSVFAFKGQRFRLAH